MIIKPFQNRQSHHGTIRTKMTIKDISPFVLWQKLKEENFTLIKSCRLFFLPRIVSWQHPHVCLTQWPHSSDDDNKQMSHQCQTDGRNGRSAHRGFKVDYNFHFYPDLLLYDLIILCGENVIVNLNKQSINEGVIYHNISISIQVLNDIEKYIIIIYYCKIIKYKPNQLLIMSIN